MEKIEKVFFVVIDRWRNRLFTLLGNQGPSAWESTKRGLEDDEHGSIDQGGAHLIEELPVNLPEDLQYYFESLLLLDSGPDRDPWIEPRIVWLAGHFFELGLKSGVKHADELRARQVQL